MSTTPTTPPGYVCLPIKEYQARVRTARLAHQDARRALKRAVAHRRELMSFPSKAQRKAWNAAVRDPLNAEIKRTAAALVAAIAIDYRGGD